jgi:hypothetical protein
MTTETGSLAGHPPRRHSGDPRTWEHPPPKTAHPRGRGSQPALCAASTCRSERPSPTRRGRWSPSCAQRKGPASFLHASPPLPSHPSLLPLGPRRPVEHLARCEPAWLVGLARPPRGARQRSQLAGSGRRLGRGGAGRDSGVGLAAGRLADESRHSLGSDGSIGWRADGGCGGCGLALPGPPAGHVDTDSHSGRRKDLPSRTNLGICKKTPQKSGRHHATG